MVILIIDFLVIIAMEINILLNPVSSRLTEEEIEEGRKKETPGIGNAISSRGVIG